MGGAHWWASFLREPFVIVIEKGDPLPAGCADAGIAGIGSAAPLVEKDDAEAADRCRFPDTLPWPDPGITTTISSRLGQVWRIALRIAQASMRPVARGNNGGDQAGNPAWASGWTWRRQKSARQPSGSSKIRWAGEKIQITTQAVVHLSKGRCPDRERPAFPRRAEIHIAAQAGVAASVHAVEHEPTMPPRTPASVVLACLLSGQYSWI